MTDDQYRRFWSNYRKSYTENNKFLMIDEYCKVNSKTADLCKVTGKHIIWYDTNLKFVRGCRNFRIAGKYFESYKTVNSIKYFLSVSEEGMLLHFGQEWLNVKNKSRIFNSCNKFSEFAYNIPKHVSDEKNKTSSVTLENQIRKYGDAEGRKRYKAWCLAQSITASTEFLTNKHGAENCKRIQKSKAVTLENQIRKYGDAEGRKRYTKYCNIQSLVSTNEYLLRKFGPERFAEISNARCRNLAYFMAICNSTEEAIAKFESANRPNIGYVSSISKEMINFVLSTFPELEKKSYHSDNEFGKYCKSLNSYVKYDFVNTSYKIVIEFHGDVFHANPKLFKSDECPNFFNRDATSYDIWERDRKKIQVLTDLGYHSIIVWEYDWHNNKSQTKASLFNTINKIINNE